MSSTQLPDFERTLALAQGNLEAPDLAECHGVNCGLLCRLPDASLDAFLGLLDMCKITLFTETEENKTILKLATKRPPPW